MKLRDTNGVLLYPYTLECAFRDFPNRSFSVDFDKCDLTELGIYNVKSVMPEYDIMTQKCSEGFPKKVQDEYVQTWLIEELSQSEIDVRRKDAIIMMKSMITKKLDDFAKQKDYDNIMTACSYSTSTVPAFINDSLICIKARDDVWSKFYEIMDDVNAEKRSHPRLWTDISDELPVLSWSDNA